MPHQWDSSTLANHIVRNVEYPHTVAPSIAKLANDLLGLRTEVPTDTNLILGGSLARGEPSFVRGEEDYELASDIDLLLVHDSVLPPLTADEFVARTSPVLPTISLMTVSRSEYERLRTTIGYEFKDIGVSLNQPALPPHEPVTLGLRDAYEFFLFSIEMYFWERTADRWAAGDNSMEFHLPLNRICVKLLRACGMLTGGYNHHDAIKMPARVRDLMADEIEWRKNPSPPPPDPGRFWPILAMVMRAFDDAHGVPKPDAVTGTEYEGRDGAAYVARHQRIAHSLARRILAQTGGGHAFSADELVAVKQREWASFVEMGVVRPVISPEVFFSERANLIRANLFEMKVSPPPGGNDESALF